jgi:hypothetical protein
MTVSYLTFAAQPMLGPHLGPGNADVAARWRAIPSAPCEENDAQPTTAITAANTTTRKATFIENSVLNRLPARLRILADIGNGSAEARLSPCILVGYISGRECGY